MAKDAEETVDLNRLIGPLFKWWWLILASMLLAAGASYLAVRQEPTVYRSRVTLLIGRPFDSLNPNQSQLWLSQQLAQTYAGFAQREPVRNATLEALGLEWLPQYSASVPPQTAFIEITVLDTDPERAQLVAAELGNQLIQLSPAGENQEEQQRQVFIDEQLDELQSQIEGTKNEIETKQLELGDLFSAREIAASQEQIGALQTKLSSLQLNYATLLSNSERQATNAVTVFEPAGFPQSPIGPQKLTTVLLAAALGAALASAAAYVLEYLDDRVRTPEVLQRVTGLLPLASIPHTKFTAGPKSELVTSEHPRAPVSEAFRHLRTAIQFSEVNGRSRTILVTSATPAEGKSFISANLALVLAQAGMKTLLIDGDLRRPSLHETFGIANHLGLTDLMLILPMIPESSKVLEVIDEHVHLVPQLGLHVLPRGSLPPNPSELLGSPVMRTLLDYVSERYDYVVIDSAPSLAVTDSIALATRVDGVLTVLNTLTSRTKEVKQMIARLREVDAHLIGAVLNNVPARSSSYYYGYSYTSEEAPEETETKPTSRWPVFESLRQNRLD